MQFAFSSISAEYLQKIRVYNIYNFPKYCSDMRKVRWICSKFHALVSSVKFLKIG